MQAKAILETAIYAENLDACERFYRDVFGLEVIRKAPGIFVFLRVGNGVLLIFDPRKSSPPDPATPIPRHGSSGPGHFCFRADGADEVIAWRDRFVSLGIAIERFHEWPQGGTSVYIRDPAGNSVEVADSAIWGLA